MKDITYCNNESCPFEDCERHWKHLEGETGLAWFADYTGTCRRYIGYLVDKLFDDDMREIF